MEDIHSWFEPLSESFIAVLRFIQFFGFRFKYGEDVFGGSAAVYFCSEGVASQVFPGLPSAIYKPAWKVLFVLVPGLQAARICLATE